MWTLVGRAAFIQTEKEMGLPVTVGTGWKWSLLTLLGGVVTLKERLPEWAVVSSVSTLRAPVKPMSR